MNEVKNFFSIFFNNNNIEHYSGKTDKGATFAERFWKIIRSLLKNLFLKKGEGNWIDVLPKISKQCNIRVHTSTKLTPIQASLKKNEGYVYKNIIEKRKRVKPKFPVNDVVRTADSERTFSKRDTTSWSYNLEKSTEGINDKIPSYRIDNLQER